MLDSLRHYAPTTYANAHEQRGRNRLVQQHPDLVRQIAEQMVRRTRRFGRPAYVRYRTIARRTAC